MKVSHYLIAFLTIIQINLVLGQDFAPVGAEWIYRSSGGGTVPTGSEYFHLSVEKDTIINDYHLRKITRTYRPYQSDLRKVEPYFIHQSGDTVSLYNEEKDKLYKLFVFNASQGDTLVMDIPYEDYFSGDTTYRVIIDSIATETYDGVELKKYILHQPDDFGWFNGFYLEKVGGHEWFLPLGKTIIPESVGPVICYHNSEIDINVTSGTCYYRTIISTDELSETSIALAPNPTSDYAQIESDDKIDRAVLIDNTGKVLEENASLFLNMTQYERGVYFVKIFVGDQAVTKKIIKY